MWKDFVISTLFIADYLGWVVKVCTVPHLFFERAMNIRWKGYIQHGTKCSLQQHFKSTHSLSISVKESLVLRRGGAKGCRKRRRGKAVKRMWAVHVHLILWFLIYSEFSICFTQILHSYVHGTYDLFCFTLRKSVWLGFYILKYTVHMIWFVSPCGSTLILCVLDNDPHHARRACFSRVHRNRTRESKNQLAGWMSLCLLQITKFATSPTSLSMNCLSSVPSLWWVVVTLHSRMNWIVLQATCSKRMHFSLRNFLLQF